MKRFGFIFSFIAVLFIFFFFGIEQVLAQTSQKTPEEIAAEKGITFPIAELGNCSDFNSCRTFCEDPVNRDTCIDFAKKKGFHEEPSTRASEILGAAKQELGCDSEASCRVFCEQEASFQKCSSFAQKHNLGGGQVHDPSKAEILQKAKTILGCDSPSSCRAFCEQEVNRETCSEFAKQTGLRGGEHQAGPGGCTSEETCKAFCSDPANFQVCSGFHSSVGRDTKDFRGPGGCNSEESCRVYCQANPNECGYGGGERNYDPIETCNKTPNCSWQNNTCQCSSSGRGTGGAGEGGTHPTPTGNINPEDYCKQYPERCNFTPYPSPTGIPNYTPYPTEGTGGYNYPTYQPTSTYSPSTSPPTTESTLQSSEQYQQPTSTTSPEGVQGAATSEGLLQKLFRLILTSK